MRVKPPERLQNELTVVAGSASAEVDGQFVSVHSVHRQTVDRLGEGLAVTGAAPDGTIEGLECRDAPLVAVQWHPELLPRPDPNSTGSANGP